MTRSSEKELSVFSPLTRREAIAVAATVGASLAWPFRLVRASTTTWRERRDLYPQGVASADPEPNGVILWTRRPPVQESAAARLTAEIATDQHFHEVVSSTRVTLSAASDWTCRVLAAGLAPARVYWYRFTDEHGFGSRVGRTITAPAPNDDHPVHFTFVSCQNVQAGACNAYRRMIWEDERRTAADQLGFVLHLGDFVYEVVWYPEDRPQGYYARKLKDLVRYSSGEKHADFHVPTTVDDYRALYRAYLLDPDLQDARARWPFVCMPDNHEFSWKGWQSQENFAGTTIAAQTRKVAANQAWFEYQPARLTTVDRAGLARFRAPRVSDAPLTNVDDHGLGLEPNNIAAIESLVVYRSFRYGKNAELLLTDNRSFRSEPLSNRPETAPFQPKGFPAVVCEDVTEILDAGRAMNDGRPPETIAFGGVNLPNPRRTAPPLSMLGAKQKAWFLERLRGSATPWKIWGNSVAMLDWRIDFQNLPPELGPHWPTTGYALLGDDDWSGYRHERAEIFEFVRAHGITGLATVCGDRHSFLAGLLSPTLPPKEYRPIGVEFVTGSISAPGLFEAMEFGLPPSHPLRPVFVHQPSHGGAAQPAINVAVMHGVRASLALNATGDLTQITSVHNEQLAPQLSFADLGGHGYAVVHVASETLAVEFVAVPRPLERAGRDDGGPIAYRVTHTVRRWKNGESPRLERGTSEGQLPLVL